MNFPSIKIFNCESRRTKRYLHNHYIDFEKYLEDHYNFVDKWSEKIYCFYHDINDPPTCPVCGKTVKFYNFNKGYNKYCSSKCCGLDPERKLQIKQTCLEKYGVEHPFQSQKIRNKYKQTCLKKYGVEHPVQSKEIQDKFKQTCLEKYGVENPMFSKSVKNKLKQTCLERYGVENPFQSQESQNKYKQTCLDKYGVENPFQSRETRNKYKQTCLEKYGKEHYNNRDKAKQTCLKKYGIENPFQSRETRNKYKQTCLEKYGVENPSQSQEIQNKVKQTCLNKYGVERYNQSDEGRTKLSSILSSDKVQNKTKQTCLEKYGTENYSQSSEYRSRYDEIQAKINNAKHQNHTFNSSQTETDFAAYLMSQNIEYKRQYRSKEYPFNCDFYLPKYDLYIEIQGSWVHGHHPFDKEIDKDTLERWKSKNTDYYKRAIETWTERDVNKRNIAKQNHLKYLEIFSDKLDDMIKNLNAMIKRLL